MNTDTQIEELEREIAQYKEALKEEARMSEIEEQLTKAHGHVRQAEIIMEKLGHEKYSLSGMCSAAMRHDLEQEVSKLLRELADMTKQRDALAEALKSLCRAIISEEPQDITDLLKQSGSAIAAVEGGNDE